MKNVFRLIGLIAIAVVIGFSVAACGESKDDEDDKEGKDGDTGLNAGSDGALGPTVNVPEVQVYELDVNTYTGTASTRTINLDQYLGAGEIPASLSNIPGSSVKITNGKLTLKLGTPTSGTVNANDFIDQMFSGATVADTTANILIVMGFTSTTDSSNELVCMNVDNSCSVILVYADKPITTWATNQNMSIDFKLTTGWNIVFMKGSGEEVYSGNDLTGFNWYYRPASN
jgi:hypothetical protein